MLAPSALTLTSTRRPATQAAGLLRTHLGAALAQLAPAKPNGARIHAARKELKRARAILRLMREAIGRDDYDEADAELRGTARMLNDVRDADVVLRALARLCRSADESASLEPLRRLLLEERRQARSATLGKRLKDIRAALLRCKDRTRAWSIADDIDLMMAGMQRTYRNARRCYRAACETHSDEHLHAWRRQVKYCAYQLEAIRPVGSRKMHEQLINCTKVADLLGKDHDLAILHQRAGAADLDAASALHFADMIGHERARLQRKALKLGDQLYRAKPRVFQQLARQ